MKPNTVHVNIDSSHWGGDYVANIHAVSSLLTDTTARRRAHIAEAYWPEIWQHVEARKQFRRFPAFVQAIILRQL
jgi:hypothetical protein